LLPFVGGHRVGGPIGSDRSIRARLRSSPDPLIPINAQSHDATGPEPRLDEAAGDDDLHRLEVSVQRLKRQVMIARLETGHRDREENRRLPRVGLLPRLSGIPPVDTEGSVCKRETMTSLSAPPLACERLQLQPPRRPPRHYLRAALCLLTASVIVGSFAYHVSSRGLFSAWEAAQASALQSK
jgi:hypothetical protein